MSRRLTSLLQKPKEEGLLLEEEFHNSPMDHNNVFESSKIQGYDSLIIKGYDSLKIKCYDSLKIKNYGSLKTKLLIYILTLYFIRKTMASSLK